MSFGTEKKLNTITIILVLVLIFIVLSNFIKVNYFITAPGLALPLDKIITVEKGKKDAKGAFYLTAVTSKQASLFNYIYITLVKPKGIELTPKELTLPPEMDMEQYIKIMEDMMVESQMFAKVVALRKMGYETDIRGHGAEVVEIMENSNAREILEKGDIIVAIDGEPVSLASEAVQLIQRHEIGDIVKLQVKRNEELLNFEVKTIELKENPGKASVGIYIMTHNREYSFPLDIDISTENIIGPSAGTMFALEIINQLHPEDITKGYKIAGTGTIDLEGRVGTISGVVQKVMAAEARGVDYFFVPLGNYEEAKAAATSVKVVKVETIDDALNFLKKLTEQ
ncbi:signal protein PDZ [Anoxybacter fermentans]|uniref:endopeptidase La n=1 Tax=Anoxybacter fermentans TaxID=1323375 RepID=A0A3Q9HPN0_9FIRM|nr:PDZ domain-containing protein [Anoxybacter fermentans]AZR72737.1 signal protein PDZ [Anoxybacter fermentans]